MASGGHIWKVARSASQLPIPPVVFPIRRVKLWRKVKRIGTNSPHVRVVLPERFLGGTLPLYVDIDGDIDSGENNSMFSLFCFRATHTHTRGSGGGGESTSQSTRRISVIKSFICHWIFPAASAAALVFPVGLVRRAV